MIFPTKGYHILIIDNSEKITLFLQRQLLPPHYIISRLSCPLQTLEFLKIVHFHIIILKLSEDNASSYELAQKIQSLAPQQNFIFLFKNYNPSNIENIFLKSNISIKTIVSVHNLITAIHTILPCYTQTLLKQPLTTAFCEFFFCSSSNTLKKQAQYIHLTETERNILIYLLQHKNQQVLKEDLTPFIKKYHPLSRSVDIHTSRLRHKLQCAFHKNHIINIRSRGYILQT